MIPRKMTEEEKQAAFELLLKDNSQIANLNKAEAEDFYQLADKEYRVIIKQSNDLEAYDHLQFAREKSKVINDLTDKMFDDLSYKAGRKMMEDNRSSFVIGVRNGFYVSGLTEVIEFCHKYNIEFPLEPGRIYNRVIEVVNNLEEVIDLLHMRRVMPYVKEKEPKTKQTKVTTLQEACLGKDQYEAAKAWFISKGFCDPITMAWKGRKQGDRSVLVLMIRNLIKKGYARPLKATEVMAIVENTFKLEVGIDTAKRPVQLDYDRIPYFKKL